MSPQLVLPAAFENLFEYESFLTILRYYVDLNCFVISPDPGDGGSGWLAIHYNRRPNSLYEFEKKYRFQFHWEKLVDPAFERARAKGRPLLLESLGFYDIFTPIRRKGKRLGTVLSGAFADRELTYDHLRESWHRLTGQTASAENPEFREFVRVMLDTPVLEGPVLSAYQEALELFASVMAGGRSAPASHRLKELFTTVFSKQLPHSYWMDWALGLPTAQATPIWNLGVQDMDWVKADIGISRIPTTVITVVPSGSDGKKRDPVEERLRVYRFQRRAFRFSQGLAQTVGGKLENYGAVFVTSADPHLGRPQRKRQILETAQAIHRFAVEELGGAALVGIGETVPPGEPLSESYRQAVLALHLRRGTEKELVFFESEQAPQKEGLAELTRLLLGLKRRFETASFAGLEEMIDSFLKQALTLSFENPEEIRWHLHYGLLKVGEAVKNRTDLPWNEVSRMIEKLGITLEKSATTQEMVLSFKDALEKLAGLAGQPGKTKEFYSMEKVRDHLERHFRAPGTLLKLAGMAGVSVSTFGRQFKKKNGVGVETYLQNLRVNEARRLLQIGSLSVAQIAQACGFQSTSYFIHLFRKKTQVSPGEFRKKSKTG
jgi:AraC-like DNA-binding protein